MKNILILVSCVFSATCYAQTAFDHTYGLTNFNCDAVDLIQTSDGGYVIVGNTFNYTPGGTPFESSYISGYVVKVNSQGDTLWTKNFSESSYGSYFKVHELSGGNIVMFGQQGASYTCHGIGVWYPPFADQAFLKLDKNGSIITQKKWVADCGQDFNNSQKTSDQGFAMLGTFVDLSQDETMLHKIDSSGNTQWIKYYPYINTTNAFVQTNDDGYMIAYDKNAGMDRDVFLVKTDPSGDTIWTKNIRDTSYQAPIAICRADGNNLLVMATYGPSTATAFYKINPQGDTIWSKKYIMRGVKMISLNNGEFLVLGTEIVSYGYAITDLYVMRLSAAGDSISTKIYGNINRDVCAQIIQTTDNSFSVLSTQDAYNLNVNPSIYHLIKDDELSLGTINLKYRNITLTLSPNPFQYSTIFRIQGLTNEKAELTVYNCLGEPIETIQDIVHPEILLENKNMTPGFYYYRLRVNDVIVKEGKMVMQ